MQNDALEKPLDTIQGLFRDARDGGKHIGSEEKDAMIVATRQLLQKNPEAITTFLGSLIHATSQTYNTQQMLGAMLDTFSKINIKTLSPAAQEAGLRIAITYADAGGHLNTQDRATIGSLTQHLITTRPEQVLAVAENLQNIKETARPDFHSAMAYGLQKVDVIQASPEALRAGMGVLAIGASETCYHFGANETIATTAFAAGLLEKDPRRLEQFAIHSDGENIDRKFGEALARGTEGADYAAMDTTALNTVIALQQRHANPKVLHAIFVPMLQTEEGRKKMNGILQKPLPERALNPEDFLSNAISAVDRSGQSGEACQEILETIAANKKMPYLVMHELLQKKHMAGAKTKLMESSAQVRAAYIWRFQSDATDHDKIPARSVADFLHITTLGKGDNVDSALQKLIERCGKGGVGSGENRERQVAADILQTVLDKGKVTLTNPTLVARDLAKAVRRHGSRASARLGNQKPLKVLAAVMDRFKLHSDVASYVHSPFENADNGKLTLLGATSKGFAKKFLKKNKPAAPAAG